MYFCIRKASKKKECIQGITFYVTKIKTSCALDRTSLCDKISIRLKLLPSNTEHLSHLWIILVFTVHTHQLPLCIVSSVFIFRSQYLTMISLFHRVCNNFLCAVFQRCETKMKAVKLKLFCRYRFAVNFS